ncbi:MAG: cell division protein ZapA [Paracoccaceae bacterium]|jgi:cell division protein ZapA
MADLEVQIGTRSYRVACENGQEPHLAAVADRLRQEASVLTAQFGTLPETRLLLMSGLLVADRLHTVEARAAEAAAIAPRLAAAEAQLAEAADRVTELTGELAQASADTHALRGETERALAARARAQDALDVAQTSGRGDAAAAERIADLEAELAALRNWASERLGDGPDDAASARHEDVDDEATSAAERDALRDRIAAAEHRNAVMSDQLDAAEEAAAESARALEEATRRIRVLIGDIEDGVAA